MKISIRLYGVPILAVLACMLAAFILLANTQVFAQSQIVIAQSDITEKEAYDAAKELGTIEAWEAFLNSYSTGFRADLARAYLKRIASEAPKTAQPTQAETPPPPPVEVAAPPPPPPPALPADISLAMTSQGACAGGQNCSYMVTATNTGGELYSGALTIATSVAPGGARLQGTGTPPYSCQDMGGGAVCSHGDANIAPGQSATIPLVFTLPRNAGGQVTACASIAWGGVPAVLGPIEVQRKLNELGFNAGAVDGQPGRKTVSAIRAYQASAGLQQTGEMDLPLLLSLFAHPGQGDANPANDQACAGAAVTAPVTFTPQPQIQYCGGGRIRDARGNCACPATFPVWTGKTCIPRKVRNCTGGRYYSKKRKLCLCPARKPHWYNNRCYAGVDDCPGDSTRVGSQCIKQDEPGFQGGGQQARCPSGQIQIGNNCININLAPLFNLGKKQKGGSQTFTGGGNRPNRPQGGATVAQPGGAQGVQGGGNPSMSGGRCPQPSMVFQNGKCKCIGGSVRGACITAFNVKTFACKDLPPGGAWKVYRPDCAGSPKTGGGQPTVTNKPSGGGGLKCAAGTKNIGGKCLSQQQINAGLASRQCRPGNFAAFIPGGVVDCKPCTALWAIKKGSWPYKAGSCQGGVKKPAPPQVVNKMTQAQVRSQLFSHCRSLGESNANCSTTATALANNIFAKGLDPAKGLAQSKAEMSVLAKAKQQKPVQKQIICKAGTGLIVQNGKCACPGNKRWNGKVCAATGIKCAPDQKPAGNRCVPRCGIGFRWNGSTCIKDQSKTTTKEIICSSNLVPVNGQCKCPPGLTWNGKVCAGPQKLQAKPRPVINICVGGAQKVGNTCRCPGGQAPQLVGTDRTQLQIKQLYQCPNQQQPAQQQQQKINCTGGRVANRNGQCQCPANKPRWNGSYCKNAKKSNTDKANKFLKQFQQPQNQPQGGTRPQQQQIQIPGLGGITISDARLKRDIAHVATRKDGLKLYSFRYLWSDEAYVGVMAQDLLEDPAKREAVSLHENGHYMVDYGSLGLHMVTLDAWQSSRR